MSDVIGPPHRGRWPRPRRTWRDEDVPVLTIDGGVASEDPMPVPVVVPDAPGMPFAALWMATVLAVVAMAVVTRQRRCPTRQPNLEAP